MRVALVALALAFPAASSAEAPVRTGPAAVPSRVCGDDLKVRHAKSPEGQRLRRLGELPSGSLTLGVVSRVGDCIEPVVIRHGFGLASDGKSR